MIESLLLWLSKITIFLTEILYTFQARMAKYAITLSAIISVINLKRCVTSLLLWLHSPKAVCSQLQHALSVFACHTSVSYYSPIWFFFNFNYGSEEKAVLCLLYIWENWDLVCSNQPSQARPLFFLLFTKAYLHLENHIENSSTHC